MSDPTLALCSLVQREAVARLLYARGIGLSEWCYGDGLVFVCHPMFPPVMIDRAGVETEIRWPLADP